MSEWGEQTVQRAAAEIRRRRTELRLSAQALADRTTALGHTVTRTTIADLELGRRGERLTVPDLVALAAALHTSPGILLFPDMPHGQVETLPGIMGTSLSSARWFGTQSGIMGPGGEYSWPTDRESFEHVISQNTLARMSMGLEGTLGELETMVRLSQEGHSAKDWALESYGHLRKQALKEAKRLRGMGGILDEERLARLGVIDLGDDIDGFEVGDDG